MSLEKRKSIFLLLQLRRQYILISLGLQGKHGQSSDLFYDHLLHIVVLPCVKMQCTLLVPDLCKCVMRLDLAPVHSPIKQGIS